MVLLAVAVWLVSKLGDNKSSAVVDAKLCDSTTPISKLCDLEIVEWAAALSVVARYSLTRDRLSKCARIITIYLLRKGVQGYLLCKILWSEGGKGCPQRKNLKIRFQEKNLKKETGFKNASFLGYKIKKTSRGRGVIEMHNLNPWRDRKPKTPNTTDAWTMKYIKEIELIIL